MREPKLHHAVGQAMCVATIVLVKGCNSYEYIAGHVITTGKFCA